MLGILPNPIGLVVVVLEVIPIFIGVALLPFEYAGGFTCDSFNRVL